MNHKEVVLKKGDEVDLICTAESEALGCSFKSPADQDYNMLQVVKYFNQISILHNICRIEISSNLLGVLG